MSPAHTNPQSPPAEWFTKPDPVSGRDGTGLKFSCTLCGNCCSGPAGYVLVSDAEIAALAKRVGLTPQAFAEQYTHMTEEGRSLTEKKSKAGLDCVFLDRGTIPGKAICGVYEDRPIQCRTWPFWPSVVGSKAAWERAKKVCPGMDKGTHHDLVQIRVARDSFKI